MANKRVRQRIHPAVISEQAADTVQQQEHTHTERVSKRSRLTAVEGHAYTLLYVQSIRLVLGIAEPYERCGNPPLNPPPKNAGVLVLNVTQTRWVLKHRLASLATSKHETGPARHGSVPFSLRR